MTIHRIIAIVEGHGDEAAVPVLLRRLCLAVCEARPVEVLHPIRVPRQRLLKEAELGRAIELAARRTDTGDLILIIVDADDDCPSVLGPKLANMARPLRQDRRVEVVLAKTEFETWFLAAAKSLSGRRGLRNDLQPPTNAEGIRNAKGWLSDQMSNKTARYSEILDQPALAQVFDFQQAKASPSFARLYDRITLLLTAPIAGD
jgi:hypothetical protein